MTHDSNPRAGDARLLHTTRRHLFAQCGLGIGSAALASLLTADHALGSPAEPPDDLQANPLAPRPGHFTPRADAVIYLFMAGGPSQLELFHPRPELQKRHGEPIPESVLRGKRFAFMDTFLKNPPRLLGSKRAFTRHGQSGAWVSDLLPEIGKVVDDLTFIHSMTTEPVNHAPAKLFANTGSTQFGRPSFGAWVTYGIGSESRDLPGFVVLQSGPRGPRGGAPLWGSGFLPTAFQGVPFRNGPEPIVDLSLPPGVDAAAQGRVVAAVNRFNEARLQAVGDQEIRTRMAAYEMAYRMQTSAPELMSILQESSATLRLYGVEPGVPSFAANCLLARRMVERGVRFIQLYHTSWDHHGGPGETLEKDLPQVCREVDQASAALVRDLKSRGLLDRTLVVWGSEFGRTPMGEIRENTGRNHHVEAYTMWLAGGGLKPGLSYGETDEFGFGVTRDKVHVHDLQATILHLLGLDHLKLTYRFQGRAFRLTDVGGHVIHSILG